jgi:hypothetical protein
MLDAFLVLGLEREPGAFGSVRTDARGGGTAARP